MKKVSMSGSPRENVGKKDAKKHRREGKVPCVLYGGEKQYHFTVNDRDFSKVIFTPEVYIINLKIGDKEYNAILQDVQYHPVTDVVLHVDFLEILPGKPVVIGIPVSIEGNAPGVLKGGRLVKKMRKLKVKGLIDELPEKITLNIDKLDIGDSIKIKDVKVSNLEFLDSPNAEVIGVKTARAVVSIEEEEEAAEAAAAEGEGGEETPKEESAE
jgi:large subunit ribosomal protein L25